MTKFNDYVPKDLENGGKALFSSDGQLVVGKGGTAFTRVGIRIAPDGETQEAIRWMVGELNGVRVYFDGTAVVLTTEDMYI